MPKTIRLQKENGQIKFGHINKLKINLLKNDLKKLGSLSKVYQGNTLQHPIGKPSGKKIRLPAVRKN